MKKLGKLKLNQLSKADLEKKEMNIIKGGSCACACICSPCGCLYAGEQCGPDDNMYGGSSIAANDSANDSANIAYAVSVRTA